MRSRRVYSWQTKAKLADLPTIPAELLEQFGNGPMAVEAINAATLAIKKTLIERALGGKINYHLGYSPGATKSTTLAVDGKIKHAQIPRTRRKLQALTDRPNFLELQRRLLAHQSPFVPRRSRPSGVY
ncbi:hypothetical protein R8510_04758 [Ralstonia chuxiongensis]|nr:hypothetical protein R8510_04758 [Ralstonia chuxiongensis]